MKKAISSLLLALLVGGCAGYRLGPATPAHLSHIKTIAVPTFANTTLVPRIEALVTGTVIKQFQQDGTFRIGSEGQADAVLKAEIVAVGRNPARSVRGNVLSTTEFNLNLSVRYSLVGRDGKPLSAGGASGNTSFFVGSDVSTDERQALPLAAEEMAKQLVSQLSEGW
ncbi:MAG TPA: LptE family protein [Chthoniobacterales bacterium]|nr:LptE family protein [Chthoniobacterales bacterium]